MGRTGHLLLGETTLRDFCSTDGNESSKGPSSSCDDAVKRSREENGDGNHQFPSLSLSAAEKKIVLSALGSSSTAMRSQCSAILEEALRQSLLRFYVDVESKRLSSSLPPPDINVKVQPAIPTPLMLAGSTSSFRSDTRFTLSFSLSSCVEIPWPNIQVGEFALPVYYEEETSSQQDSGKEEEERRNRNASFLLPVLLVGAGGIGCEVLKVLILSGYRNIHLIDLDTIDGTNLNRQFLFSTSDVGKSKSFTARETILRWWGWREGVDPSTLPVHEKLGAPPKLVAYHDDIKAPYFDRHFFGSFAAVLNALDNVSARQHVNRLCCQAGVPLIESGTMGYNGQVQPILPGHSECYDCRPKPSDKVTYAVCTIHSRPTKLVHCVHYAKEIYEVLFGDRQHEVRNDEVSPSSAASNTDAGGSELGYLRAWRSSWLEKVEEEEVGWEQHRHAAVNLAKCIFHDKIVELLQMKSSWPTQPPDPLELSAINNIGKMMVEEPKSMEEGCVPLPKWSGILDFDESSPTLEGLMHLFIAAATHCCARRGGASASDTPIGFAKEDDLTIAFVAATANLRAHIFHIGKDSVEGVRTIAGNIVPAIVTTNAIAGAGVVRQLDILLKAKKQFCSSHSLSPQLQEKEEDKQPPSADLGEEYLPEHTQWMRYAAQAMQTVYIRKAPLILRHTAPGYPQFGVKRLRDVTDDIDAERGLKERRRENNRSRGKRSFPEAYTVHTVSLSQPPLPSCLVCHPLRRPPRVVVTGVDFNQFTLRQLAEEVISRESDGDGDGMGMEEPTISLGPRILYEAEGFEELGGHTLSQFATDGQFPSVAGLLDTNLDVGKKGWRPLVFVVESLNHDLDWEVEVVHHDQNSSISSAAPLPKVTGFSRALAHEAAVLHWRESGGDVVSRMIHGETEEKGEGVDESPSAASGDAFIIEDEDDVEEVL